MEYLSVIQGDTLDAILELINPQELAVSKITFYCKSLDLNIELQEMLTEDSAYALTIPPTDTQHFGVGNWNFDIIVDLESGERYTVVRGQLEVKYRKAYD